jgi:predicted nucleic acid-binding Zn ribbon protein
MMDTHRKEKKGFVSLGSVLPNILSSIRKDGDAQLLQVWKLWDRSVGEAIAKNTRPSAFKGKLLLVEVTSSAWIHELQFLKSDIINKLNNALGKELVEEIKFKIGSFK